jgi:hypothetical protein
MNKKRLLTVMGASPLNFTQTTYKGEAVYGVTWDKTDTALTRTNASASFTAEAGVDATPVTNDFDTASIFSEFADVTDSNGNEFVRIPLLYIKKTRTPTLWADQVSKAALPGGYRPWCFYDFVNHKWNDYIYVGKYPAGTTLVGGTKLNSLPNEYPLVNKNIVDFRTYAQANGAGYHQLDIHVMDLLQTLFTVEFATLDSQAIMSGWTSGNYNAAHTLTADTVAANTIVVSNTTGAAFAVGQPVSLGTSQGGNQIFYGRNITQIDIDTPGAGNTTITVDGAVFNASIGNYLYNVGWKSGFSSSIAASSGSLVSNSSGKSPMVYRGIENLYGNTWQFVDGVNINENQAWVCTDADDYASNLFASPYKQLSYVNVNANGYVKYLGHDPLLPFMNFPVDVSANYYRDYHYQSTGQRVALVGGSWINSSGAGPWCWALNVSSSAAGVGISGRLCKKGTI